MILSTHHEEIVRTPEGERVFSFPAPVQAAARTVGRAMGDLPIDIDPETGLPAENVLMDAADLAGAFTGAGLLAKRPAGSLGMGGREDVSDTLLMQQPKKRPKIRQMPEAEQNLYEAAAAFQLPREVGEGLLLPRRAWLSLA